MAMSLQAGSDKGNKYEQIDTVNKLTYLKSAPQFISIDLPNNFNLRFIPWAFGQSPGSLNGSWSSTTEATPEAFGDTESLIQKYPRTDL